MLRKESDSIPDPSNPFDLLPDESILNIFNEIAKKVGMEPAHNSYQVIAQLSAVNRRFNRIANDDSIKFTLTPSFYPASLQISANLKEYKKHALFGKLYSQVAYNNVKKVQKLLSLNLVTAHSIYPSSTVGAGGTFLHTAAVHCSDLTASYLIDQGARVNATNRQGKTPLQVAKDCLLDATTEEDKNTPFWQVRTAKLITTVSFFEQAELLDKAKKTELRTQIKNAKASIATSSSAFFASRPEIVVLEKVSETIKNNKAAPI